MFKEEPLSDLESCDKVSDVKEEKVYSVDDFDEITDK
jgi:hypothetical protein